MCFFIYNLLGIKRDVIRYFILPSPHHPPTPPPPPSHHQIFSLKGREKGLGLGLVEESFLGGLRLGLGFQLKKRKVPGIILTCRF